MIRKTLIALAILISLLALAGYLIRDTLLLMLVATYIAPEHAFTAEAAPAEPDYADPAAWAALPTMPDASDDRPAGLGIRALPVSVFFVHPTTLLTKTDWNQRLGEDEAADWILEQRVLRHQASVFNGCCAVHAPRYRQATLFSFMDDNGNGPAALDLAYADVSAAFDRFLAEIDGQPFILAGHSQGSFHAARLLRERIAGTRLLNRLVAAYLIGFSIEKDQTGDVPACDHARATGCIVGWNAVEGTGAGLFPDADAPICTNPLTWADDGSYAGHGLNLGGMGFPRFERPSEDEDLTRMALEAGVADAECRRGVLAVPELRSDEFPFRMPGRSLHVYDYGLFYLNLRKNAIERTNAYLAAI